jgi:DNA invertase Pin-like site-specific DNA recombinase
MKDMKKKGRSPHGDEHSRSKLTAKNVSRIKAMLAEGHMRVSEIARAFGVTHATIDCIGKGKTWRHVKATPAAHMDAKSEAVDETKHVPVSSDDDL